MYSLAWQATGDYKIMVRHLTARLTGYKPKPTEKANKEILSLVVFVLSCQSSRCSPFLSPLGPGWQSRLRKCCGSKPSSLFCEVGSRAKTPSGRMCSTNRGPDIPAGRALQCRGCVRLFGQRRGARDGLSVALGCVVCVNGRSHRHADALSAVGEEQRVPERGAEAELFEKPPPLAGLTMLKAGYSHITVTVLESGCKHKFRATSHW